jgi:nucleoside-diphosphate-sugar epimerase
MEKAPVFPIPGDGKYMRQPLYNRDFCRVIEWCMAHRPAGATFDIVGAERIDYVDIIKTIRWVRGLRTPLVHLPVWLFGLLLKAYALFSPRPPFTADQLRALAAGDDFNGVDLEQTFGIRPTRFAEAIQETFCDPRYSHVVVAR